MRPSTKAVFLLMLGVGFVLHATPSSAQDPIKSVRIGTQVWMAENLNVERFRNGDPIPEAKTAEEWKKAGKDHTPAWSCYDNNPDNCTKYGKLYNWYAVNDPRGLAPKGWHVPTKGGRKRDQITGKMAPVKPLAEFDILEAAAGSLGNGLKAVGQGRGKGAGTNSTGFSALLAGGRYSNGPFGGLGETADFVSATEDPDTVDVRLMALYADVEGQDDDVSPKAQGFSVRCIRDWQPDAKTPAMPLESGPSIVRQMRRGELHTYHVTLAAGEFLRAVVTARSLDLFARVVGPDGQQASEVAPNGAGRPDTVDIAARTPGRYLIGVLAADSTATSGRYDVRIAERVTAPQYQRWLAGEQARLVAEHARLVAAEKVAVDSVKGWLASHAIRLRTVVAHNGFDDMQPIKKIIGKAHVVELGEATHGTREFFQLKHRMLEFLVTEMGFTVFGIEASMPEAYAVNNYLLTGKGDPARALNGLYFWTWNTEEVLDMIQWMRQYNADPTHVKKVKFYGFDMQSAPLAVRRTLAYLQKVDPAQAIAAEKPLAPFANPITDNDYNTATGEAETAAKAKVAISTVLARFDTRKREYVRQTSAAEWAIARQHASIVAQKLEFRTGAGSIGLDRAGVVRDSSMAANIRWILDHEGPGTKMVVWAHNLHVAMQPGLMGGHLHQALGAEMVAFGFAFNQGGFQSVELPFPSPTGLRQFSVGPSPAGSVDATLAAAGLQIAAIDLRSLPRDGAVAKWFGAPRQTHGPIGSMYSEQSAAFFFTSPVMPSIYDALLFVEKTTAARANPSSAGEAPQKLKQPTNLDFEAGEPGQTPDGWVTARWMRGLGFESATTSNQPSSGTRSAMLSRPAGDYYGESAGSLTQRIDATAYRGKRVRLRVMARTDAVRSGNQAYVRLQISAAVATSILNTNASIFDNMTGTPVTSTDWKSYDVEADVPADADAIAYGVWLIGTGRVWMDAVSIEVVPKAGQGGGSPGFMRQ